MRFAAIVPVEDVWVAMQIEPRSSAASGPGPDIIGHQSELELRAIPCFQALEHLAEWRNPPILYKISAKGWEEEVHG